MRLTVFSHFPKQIFTLAAPATFFAAQSIFAPLATTTTPPSAFRLSALPPLLLACSFPAIASANVVSSTAAAAAAPASAAHSTPLQFLTKDSLRKMSNGEGYVDEISPRASKLIQDSITLFSGKPSLDIFRRSWTKDSVFEDPLCYAIGERQYKAQWYGLAAAFSKCELLAWHVTKDEPTQVNYVQRQRYTFAGIGVSKEIISTISMKLNDEGKVIHMQDRWDHKDPPAGFIAWPLRRLNAVSVPLFVSVPQDKDPKPPHQEL